MDIDWVATIFWNCDRQWGIRSKPVLRQLIVWVGIMEI